MSETTNATETTATPETQTGLTVQDLTLVLQSISVAASRGAFKAEELSTVGGLYDRVFKFLDSIGAISKPTETAPAAGNDEGSAPSDAETN